MRNINLDPYWRTSIGFDRLFDLMDESLRFEPEDHYPALQHRSHRRGQLPHFACGRRLQARTDQHHGPSKHADSDRPGQRQAR